VSRAIGGATTNTRRSGDEFPRRFGKPFTNTAYRPGVSGVVGDRWSTTPLSGGGTCGLGGGGALRGARIAGMIAAAGGAARLVSARRLEAARRVEAATRRAESAAAFARVYALSHSTLWIVSGVESARSTRN
jgi:hypothetical protein